MLNKKLKQINTKNTLIHMHTELLDKKKVSGIKCLLSIYTLNKKLKRINTKTTPIHYVQVLYKKKQKVLGIKWLISINMLKKKLKKTSRSR